MLEVEQMVRSNYAAALKKFNKKESRPIEIEEYIDL